MLLFKPHTITVYEAEQPIDPSDKSVGVREFGAGQVVHGQVSPVSADAAFRASGIEIDRPHKMLMDIADASKFRVGYRVKMGARRFDVSGPVQLFNAGLLTDHASVILAEEQYRAE